MPTEHQIDAPLSLGGFFPDSDEEEPRELDDCDEEQTVVLCRRTLRVRQYAYHSHNANRVWPGTFNLCDYLLECDGDGRFHRHWGSVLELGTATGLLAIRLAMVSTKHQPVLEATCCDEIVTSDVVDDGNKIEETVNFNFGLNGIEKQPIHVPHTWGTGWRLSAAARGVDGTSFDTIVASDILLYISAYGALVETLKELVVGSTVFVMSWNRRMKESSSFFSMMTEAGFDCVHEGKCVYTFSRVNGQAP